MSPLSAANWVNNSQVTIDGHDCQAENRRELVHRVCCHDHTAHEGAKRPIGEHILRGEEGEPEDVKLIGHSQIQDVDVGDSLHFGVAQHHIDGQRVAGQSHHEHSEGDDRSHQSAAALKRDTVSGCVGGGVGERGVIKEEG